MEFEVTEIKALGGSTDPKNGGWRAGPESLSLRLQANPYGSSRVFTIHAVVPYSPEFGTVQVGQKFVFERIETPLNERVVVNTLFPEGFKTGDVDCGYYKCPVTVNHKIGAAGCNNPGAKQA